MVNSLFQTCWKLRAADFFSYLTIYNKAASTLVLPENQSCKIFYLIWNCGYDSGILSFVLFRIILSFSNFISFAFLPKMNTDFYTCILKPRRPLSPVYGLFYPLQQGEPSTTANFVNSRVNIWLSGILEARYCYSIEKASGVANMEDNGIGVPLTTFA